MLKNLLQTHSYLCLFGLALILRLACSFVVTQPGFVDAYYYYQIAANWQAGLGLSETTLWNYQAGSPSEPILNNDLTHEAFAYWTPLASLITIASFAIFGTSFWAASLPFILCACALPPVAYWLGKLLMGQEQERYSWFMAIVMLFPGRYFLFWNAPDNFAPFALLSMLCLAAIYGGWQYDQRWWLIAGFLGGLAYLSRSDGILLTATLAIFMAWHWWESRRLNWKIAVGSLALALTIVSPWLVRNVVVLGSFFPANNTKMLFLRNYQEFFSYDLNLNLAHYLGSGWQEIIMGKLQALSLNAFLISFQSLLLLAPLWLVGLWVIRRNPAFRPFLVYTLLLYTVMSLAFTHIGSQGTLFHSAGGLIPFQAALVLAGLEQLAKRKVKVGAVIITSLVAISVTLYFVIGYNAPDWNKDYETALRLEKWFAQNATPKDVIMIGEPLSFHYATGRTAIGQASNGLEANLAAAKQYGARWFVLEPQRYKGLDELYNSKHFRGLRLVAELEGGIQIYEADNS